MRPPPMVGDTLLEIGVSDMREADKAAATPHRYVPSAAARAMKNGSSITFHAGLMGWRLIS